MSVFRERIDHQTFMCRCDCSLTFLCLHHILVTLDDGSRAGLNKSGNGYGVNLEARINKAVLVIPECGECKVIMH